MDIKQGLSDSLPIAAGYFGVSFSFGIMAAGAGLDSVTATIISLTNLTSAGQFAGLTLIAEGAGYIELFLSQLIINLRYALMSLSLSQKVDEKYGLSKRLISSFWITDEIFAVASGKAGSVSFPYMVGLGIPPIIGWSLGTLVGALAGELLPASVISALSLALYAMFIAIVLPPARDNKAIAIVAFISIAISCLIKYLPVFKGVGSGTAIIITTILAAGVGALLFPINRDDHNEGGAE